MVQKSMLAVVQPTLDEQLMSLLTPEFTCKLFGIVS